MNNTDYQIFFHVGYPKAASSSLQFNLFSDNSEINFFTETNAIFNRFYQNLRFIDSFLNANKLKKDSKELWNNHIYPYLDSYKINVFSDERIVDQFQTNQLDNTSKATLIKQWFPNAKIIIVIRNQAELIRSRYDFAFPDRSLDTWLKKLFNNKKQGYFFLESLKFYELICFYFDLFGKNNVKVLLFEQLNYDPKSFCQQLSHFMGVSENNTFNALTQSNMKKHYKDNYYHYMRIRKKYFLISKLVSIFLKLFIKTRKNQSKQLWKNQIQICHHLILKIMIISKK